MSAQSLKAAATGQVTATEAKNPFEVLKRQLEGNKAEFKPLLGSDDNVNRFVRVVLNACVATPDLVNADRRTLLTACMKAAQDGLQPDGREAVLNIYNSKVKRNGRDEWVQAVQYLPMVGGMIKLLYESGEVTYIDAAAVYANDRFTFTRGESPKLEHEPTAADDPGPLIAAYVIIKLKSGETKREVMFRRDIEAVRAVSKAGKSEHGPWVKWYDQQAIKSVIKRAYKQMPKPDRFERVEASDNEALGFAPMGSVIASSMPTAAAPAPAALENNASETLEQSFDFSAATIDDDGVILEASAPAPAAKRAKAEPAEDVAPKGPTYAELHDALKLVKDRDGGLMVMDRGRALPADQQRDLETYFNERFPE